MRDVVGCDAARTPIGRFGDSLTKVRADDLAAAPSKALMAFSCSAEIFDTTIGWRFSRTMTTGTQLAGS